jgi:hypothetical protein
MTTYPKRLTLLMNGLLRAQASKKGFGKDVLGKGFLKVMSHH